MTTENQIAFPIQAVVDLKPETVLLIQKTAEYENFSITLKSTQDRITAADQLAKIKGLAKDLDAVRKEMKKPFDDGGKKVQEQFNPKISMLEKAENILKQAMLAYDAEAERKQREAEAKAQEEARKKSESMQAKAEVMREKGKDELADALEQNAETIIAAPVVAPVIAPVKTSGTSTRKTYKAKVVDLMALVKAVAEGKAPLNVITADQSVLDKMASALKDSFTGIYAGVELDVSTSISQRSASPYKE